MALRRFVVTFSRSRESGRALSRCRRCCTPCIRGSGREAIELIDYSSLRVTWSGAVGWCIVDMDSTGVFSSRKPSVLRFSCVLGQLAPLSCFRC